MDTNQTCFVVTMVLGSAWFVYLVGKAQFEARGRI